MQSFPAQLSLVTPSHRPSEPHTCTKLRCSHSRTLTLHHLDGCRVVFFLLFFFSLLEINLCVTSSQNKALKESRSGRRETRAQPPPPPPPRPVHENRTRLKPAEQMQGEDLTDSLRPGAINLTVMSERRWGGKQAGCFDNSPRQTLSVKSDSHMKQRESAAASRGLLTYYGGHKAGSQEAAFCITCRLLHISSRCCPL